MRLLSVILIMAFCAVAAAQEFGEVWASDEVGMAQYLTVVDTADVDNDLVAELVYVAPEPDRDAPYYFWSLDLATGEVSELTDEFAWISTDPGKAPRFINVDGLGPRELLFLAIQDNGNAAQWYLYGSQAGAGTGRTMYGPWRGPALRQNKPNPLKKTTSIEFDLPAPARASIRIYDATGRIVKTLDQGKAAAGRNTATWNRDDSHGRPVPQGTYYYVLDAGGKTTARKAIVAE